MSDEPWGLIFLLAAIVLLPIGSCIVGREEMKGEVKAACADHCFPLAVHPEMDLVCQCAEGGPNE